MPRYQCPDCGQKGVFSIGAEGFFAWALKKFGASHKFTAESNLPMRCWNCSGGESVDAQTVVEESYTPPQNEDAEFESARKNILILQAQRRAKEAERIKDEIAMKALAQINKPNPEQLTPEQVRAQFAAAAAGLLPKKSEERKRTNSPPAFLNKFKKKGY